MITSRCCGQIVHMTQSVLALNNNLGRALTGIANRLYYSKDKGGKCCDNDAHTSGKKIEPWPKPDPPPPMWRPDCPQGPQPPNYDPYRIKVPDVVVPPLPPSNAKWNGVVLMNKDQCPHHHGGYQHQGQHQSCQYPGCGYQQQSSEEQPAKDKSLMGILKGFFGKLTGKGKGQGETMMLDSRHLQ